ncbi:MAG: hypothetical protein IPL08_06590 [Saprospiraceae bacterium]|nr:hypothetical protein [Saprospiraceae bacterium]
MKSPIIKWLGKMTQAKTIDREFGALEKIKDNYPKFLLTTDGFTQSRNGIQHHNVFDGC